MGVDEMKRIGNLITRAIKSDDANEHGKIKAEVQELVAKFPIYA
jgi:glycine/serine hydroxymethyltransferase